MKLNRKWILVIALVMSLAMATGGTLAYLQATDTETNTFTVGSVSIDLTEPKYPGNDKVPTLLPGVEIEKDPQITNKSTTTPAWVWMEITMPNELYNTLDIAWDTTGYWAAPVINPGASETVITMKFADPEATLAAEATTNPAFTKISLDKDITDLSNLGSGTVDIEVVAYAIQDYGFANITEAMAAYKTEVGGGEGGEGEPTLPTEYWSEVADTSWYEEAGPNATTYEISTAAELAGLAKLVNEHENQRFLAKKTVMLTADIDLGGKLWTPIGKPSFHVFYGTFDGDGHTISNVVVNEPTMNGAGLFGSVFFSTDFANTAGVKNLTVENATIIANKWAAAIVGHNAGSIENCTVKNATITVADGKAGAIAGTNEESPTIFIRNNNVKDIIIINEKGDGAVGAIVGRVWSNVCTMEHNTFENVTLNGKTLGKEIGE